MNDPPYRFSTKKALQELGLELNLSETNPYWDSMAGSSYTPGHAKDINKYLDYYVLLKDDDKKFTLMEMILDSLAEQPNESDFLKYWLKTKPLLINDYRIHQFTVHYWKQMTSEFEMSSFMTPHIQKLIAYMNSKTENWDQTKEKRNLE